MGHDVTTETFEKEVMERSRTLPVVVDFWAPWCGPCRTLGPVLEKLAEEGVGKWALVKINTDENQVLARRFNIQGIPAVKAFVDGREVDQFVGALPEPQVRTFLEKVVPDEVKQLASAAANAASAGDGATAKRLYEEVLARNPRHPDALLHAAIAAADAGDGAQALKLLGEMTPVQRAERSRQVSPLQLRLSAGPIEEAEAAIARLPDDPASRLALGNALAGMGRWEGALEQFFWLVQHRRRPQDPRFQEDAGRKGMLAVFDAIGVRSPLADTWRKKLSMELYK